MKGYKHHRCSHCGGTSTHNWPNIYHLFRSTNWAKLHFWPLFNEKNTNTLPHLVLITASHIPNDTFVSFSRQTDPCMFLGRLSTTFRFSLWGAPNDIFVSYILHDSCTHLDIFVIIENALFSTFKSLHFAHQLTTWCYYVFQICIWGRSSHTNAVFYSSFDKSRGNSPLKVEPDARTVFGQKWRKT